MDWQPDYEGFITVRATCGTNFAPVSELLQAQHSAAVWAARAELANVI
jgi:hypothetical protein